MNDPFDLSHRVAIVTGGGQGLGKAICETLAARRACVVVCDIQVEAAEAVASNIASEYAVTAIGRGCDVRDQESVRQLVDETVVQFSRIDILVNNAGIHRRGSPNDFDSGDVEDLLQTNLLGSFHFAGAVGTVMIGQKSGSIVNMSALGGGIVGLGRGGSIYGMTKGGIVALTRDLAAEWGKHNVRVNALAPGWIRTPMTEATQQNKERSAKVLERVPLRRWGEPDEVASVALFLASDASQYVTGHVIPIDGGAANVIALDDPAQ